MIQSGCLEDILTTGLNSESGSANETPETRHEKIEANQRGFSCDYRDKLQS
ncbi:hypothetical protein BaRGS_00025063, partial [Batillaria attramentaria]